MDRYAIRRRRRLLLTITAAVAVLVLTVGLLFGRRWHQEVVLRALAAADDTKATWAKRQLGKREDKGVDLLRKHLGSRGELFDLRVADYFEELKQGDLLPVEVRVRAAVAHLAEPLFAAIGTARLMELPPEALFELLRLARQLSGPELRRAALAAHQIDREESLAVTGELLGDPEPGARRLGVALLEVTGKESAAQRLAPLLADGDPSVRAEVVYGLAQLLGRECLSTVVSLLSDPSEQVREEVLQAFVIVGDAADAEKLLPALDDSSEQVRAAAVRAFTVLGAGDAASVVRARADDPSPLVREAVAQALGSLGDEGTVGVLLRLSRDTAPPVRRAAASGLTKYHGEDGVLTALERLAQDDSLDVVRAAYQALVNTRRSEVLPFFVSQLTNDRASWATDPLPSEVAGARRGAAPLGAMAGCALRWLTGRDLGYHWRSSAEERRAVQKRWEAWLTQEGAGLDPARVTPPGNLTGYEQLLKRTARSRQ